MNNSSIHITIPPNEPVHTYEPGSDSRRELKLKLAELRSAQTEIPAIINGESIRNGRIHEVQPPHEKEFLLAEAHVCGEAEVERAIASALDAHADWSAMAFSDRAAIFLKAADLVSKRYRSLLNAATMLGQSKSVHQAEIDAACELIDFLRFNVAYAARLYEEQPCSPDGVWNRMQYRSLEGFVFAVTPFNFTAIAANLPTAPALMGNVVLWKPALSSIYSSYFFYRVLEEAGLPPGVINFLPGEGPDVGKPVVASPELGGLHFTGSTQTFKHLWRSIGSNISDYKYYPRVVGETGGKNFIVAHASADPVSLATAIVRGAFEYQGQKCSAVSRCYIPAALWSEVETEIMEQVSSIKMGSVEDFGNFMNAVIDRKAFDKISGYIDLAQSSGDSDIIYGGGYSDEAGYFIEPTIVLVTDPYHRLMAEEIFGPVVSIFVYEDERYTETLMLVDETSPYGLTGAVFARNRRAVAEATGILEHAAGNFYVNDKPTGSIVGQQPFGGARGSGTNDKAGSVLNLVRWISPRVIKETFSPATHYSYPFLSSDE